MGVKVGLDTKKTENNINIGILLRDESVDHDGLLWLESERLHMRQR